MAEIFWSFGNPATMNVIPAIILIGRGPNTGKFLEVILFLAELSIDNIEDVAIRVFEPRDLHIASNVNIAICS